MKQQKNMEIKNYTKETYFKDIEVGDCFLAFAGKSRDVFIKIEKVKAYGKIWVAIRLKDGTFWPFQDYSNVKKVKVILAYKEV